VKEETRSTLRHLRRIVHEGIRSSARPSASFVACSTSFAPRSCHCSGVCTCTLSSLVGVNHALHKGVNDGACLNGILKGCAEQNAIGAVAAQGIPFHRIRGFCLYSECTGECRSTMYPCPQCYNHLLKIAGMVKAHSGIHLQLVVSGPQVEESIFTEQRNGVVLEVYTLPVQ
jgi:hypothetical protein